MLLSWRAERHNVAVIRFNPGFLISRPWMTPRNCAMTSSIRYWWLTM